MIQSATGVILRTRLLTETSLIVHWLTQESGRVATVAKGARRVKSPFLGRLDLFYLADFSYSRSLRSHLHPLREVSLRDTQSAIRQDIRRLRQAAYAAAFIEQNTETETPLPAVFELMVGFLHCLCHQAAVPQMIFAFELKLLRELGLSPDPSTTQLSAGAKQIVRALAEGDWAAALRLKLTQTQTEELQRFLHGFLIFHLGRLPQGRAGALSDN